MSRKKSLQIVGMTLIALLVIACGVSAPASPTATHTPAPPKSTSTPKPTSTPEPEPTDEPTPTPEPDAILAVALTQDPMELGDIEKLKNGYVRVWLWFPGTLKNVGNVPLTDLRICINLKYEIAYPLAGECDKLPDLAVGETADYGVGFHAEAPPDAIADASIRTTVKSRDNMVSILR